MRVCVIDGRGGGIGSRLVAGLCSELGQAHHIVALGTNLAEIQREREEAEKAAREELKKKQKTVGNGGAKGKAAEPAPKQEDKPAPAPPSSPMLSLFDLPAQDEAAPCRTSGQETKTEEEEEVSHAGQSDAP